MLRIVGKSWAQLGHKSFPNHFVDIVGCSYGKTGQPGPLFPNTSVIMMRNCSTDFVHNWLNPYYYRKATHFYVDGPIDLSQISHYFQDSLDDRILS